MIEFYQHSRRNYTVDRYSHYIYSPRELSRWVRGIFQATMFLETLYLNDFVRIFVYEAQRLFCDRLVTEGERKSNSLALEEIIGKYFPTFDQSQIFKAPLLFTNWTSRNLTPISSEEMRSFIRDKLVVFCNEELETDLVFFDDALDHILRLDRSFRYLFCL